MNNAPTANNMSTGNILKSYLVSIGINFDQEKLKDIQNRLKNFANNLKQAFLKPIEAIKNFASKFAEHLKKPLETIKNFAGKISKAFTDINKKIKAFMQTMQKAFIAISGFATAVISASLAVGKFREEWEFPRKRQENLNLLSILLELPLKKFNLIQNYLNNTKI